MYEKYIDVEKELTKRTQIAHNSFKNTDQWLLPFVEGPVDFNADAVLLETLPAPET